MRIGKLWVGDILVGRTQPTWARIVTGFSRGEAHVAYEEWDLLGDCPLEGSGAACARQSLLRWAGRRATDEDLSVSPGLRGWLASRYPLLAAMW